MPKLFVVLSWLPMLGLPLLLAFLGFRQLRRFGVSRPTRLRLILLLSPFAFQLWVCKLHKVALTAPGSGALYWFSTLRTDLLFVFLCTMLFALLLEKTRGWLRSFFVVLLHLIATSLMVLTTVEHGFFATTGSFPDAYHIQYALERFSDKGFMTLMLSQIKGVRSLGLLLPIIFALFPLAVERSKQVQAWLAETDPQASVSLRAWALPHLFIPLLILPPLPLPGAAEPLRNNWTLHVASTFFDEQDEPYTLTGNTKGAFHTLNMRAVPQNPKRMNVVFVLLESIRARSLTPYNPKLPTTPFLNSIAKRSLFVEQMHAVLPHTSKSMAPILCGVPSKVTIQINEGKLGGLPAKCLPHLLRPYGYKSAFFQPAMINFEGRAQLVQNMGFDILRGHEDFHLKGFAKTNYFGHEDRVMYKPSLRWLDQTRQQGHPFFLTYLLLVPHHTYTTPPSFPIKNYTKSRDPELNKYLNSIRYIDDFLRDLFQEFKRRKLIDNTIFVFVADHGEAFSEHGRRQHDNIMWQEGLHIPAFIYNPKLFPKQTRVQGNRQQIDIAPTIVNLLGYKTTQGNFPGTSLLKPVSPKRKLFFSCWYERQCMAMRQNQYKYIYHYRRRPLEVYNLQKDPFERNNIAKQLPRSQTKQAVNDMHHWRRSVNRVYDNVAKQMVEQATSMKEPKVQYPLNVHIGPWVRVVGYTLHRKSQFRPGGTVEITYVFQARRPIPRKWRFLFHVEFTRPHKFINADHIPVSGFYPAHRWKVGQYVLDRQHIRIPEQVGGSIRILTGLWAKGVGRQPVTGRSGTFRTNKKRLLVLERPLTP